MADEALEEPHCRTRCQHCRDAWATETFTARMCAERRRPRTVRLCGPCDVLLNRIVLTFVNARDADAKVNAYAAR